MARPFKSLKDLLAAKSGGVHAVGIDASVLDALKVMALHDVGSVLVLEGERLAGILTERDYARKGILVGRLSKDTPVREVMSTNVIAVTTANTVEQCMALMNTHKFRHLPVIEDGKPIGVLSIRDLLAELVAHHELVIQELRRDMYSILTPDPSSY